MTRPVFRLIRALAMSVALFGLVAGCDRASAGKGSPGGTTLQPLRSVEIVHPERQTVRRSVGEPGQLQAFETTPIHAKIAAYVKNWNVNIGAEVKKAQLLAELFDPELEAEHKQKLAVTEQAIAKHELAKAAVKVAAAAVAGAEAKLAEVRAGVTRAQADLARWQAEYKRVGQLFQERALTGSLLDETRSKLHSSEAAREEIDAQVQTASVAVAQTQAALGQANAELAAAASAVEVARQDARRVEALLGYTKIEAPFDGIVIQRNVDTGALTQPGADSPSLFVVARSDIVTIKVDLPEKYATEANPGDRALVKIQAMKGKAVEGKVTRLSWALDPKTRTIRAEIDIPNPGGTLRPGLYVYVTVVVEEHRDVLTVPATAVFNEKEIDHCVVVIDGKAARRPIKIGLSDGTLTEIVSGLQGGEAVVKSNAGSLTEGQPVQVERPAAK
jgi:RND family efflux transporter MFP subunit